MSNPNQTTKDRKILNVQGSLLGPDFIIYRFGIDQQLNICINFHELYDMYESCTFCTFLTCLAYNKCVLCILYVSVCFVRFSKRTKRTLKSVDGKAM